METCQIDDCQAKWCSSLGSSQEISCATALLSTPNPPDSHRSHTTSVGGGGGKGAHPGPAIMGIDVRGPVAGVLRRLDGQNIGMLPLCRTMWQSVMPDNFSQSVALEMGHGTPSSSATAKDSLSCPGTAYRGLRQIWSTSWSAVEVGFQFHVGRLYTHPMRQRRICKHT